MAGAYRRRPNYTQNTIGPSPHAEAAPATDSNSDLRTAAFDELLRGQLDHTRSCPSLTRNDEDCICGLTWRIRLQTEMVMHNAWRKRAEEAEAASGHGEPAPGLREIEARLDEHRRNCSEPCERDKELEAAAASWKELHGEETTEPLSTAEGAPIILRHSEPAPGLREAAEQMFKCIGDHIDGSDKFYYGGECETVNTWAEKWSAALKGAPRGEQ